LLEGAAAARPSSSPQDFHQTRLDLAGEIIHYPYKKMKNMKNYENILAKPAATLSDPDPKYYY
jgi:hypothetical protein